MGPIQDRCEQPGYELRPVAAIAVEKHEDVAIVSRPGAGRTGPAIAALALHDDARAGGTGALDSAVRAAAVGNDDLVDDSARDGADDLADRLLLVEGRDDHGDARACGWLWQRHQRLQRRPQLEHAGGGASGSNSRRQS